MEPIDYRSDFSFLLEITDKNGNVVPLSELDFDGQVYTAMKPGFAFACKEGVCRNCTMRGDKVLIICDRHGLSPGEVKVELRIHYPDDLYPDGIRTEVLTMNADIRLVTVQRETPGYTPKVTAISPTLIVGGRGKKNKKLHLSEYVCRGCIPSNAEPGKVYFTDRMKFDKLGAKLDGNSFTEPKRVGRVDISRLFGCFPFDETNLKTSGRIEWSYSIEGDEDNTVLTYHPVTYKLSDAGVTPMLYNLRERGYWYIDENGTLAQAKEPLPRKEWVLYLPEVFAQWRDALSGGLYELQRRENVKKARNTEFSKRVKKWVRLRQRKGLDRSGNTFYLAASEVVDRIREFNCGVFRIRRVSFAHHGTQSPWVYFTKAKNGSKEKIKRL